MVDERDSWIVETEVLLSAGRCPQRMTRCRRKGTRKEFQGSLQCLALEDDLQTSTNFLLLVCLDLEGKY
jgi:hypothetical protein